MLLEEKPVGNVASTLDIRGKQVSTEIFSSNI